MPEKLSLVPVINEVFKDFSKMVTTNAHVSSTCMMIVIMMIEL